MQMSCNGIFGCSLTFHHLRLSLILIKLNFIGRSAMFCTVAQLEKDKLADIQALEKKLGKTLIAFSCKNTAEIAKLKDDELSQIRQLEKKLNVSLVAVQ
jgi:hypothetical protein